MLCVVLHTYLNSDEISACIAPQNLDIIYYSY